MLRHLFFALILLSLAQTATSQRFEKTWSWSVSGGGNPVVRACAPRANGNALVAVYKNSALGQGSCGLAEINNQGDTVWFKQFHRSTSFGDNYVDFIRELPDKRIFMAGGVHNSSGQYHSACWITDSLGTIQLYKKMGAGNSTGNLQLTIRDVALGNDGSFYIAGDYFDLFSGGVSFYTWTVPVYAKLTASLTVSWVRSFGPTTHSNGTNKGNVLGIEFASDGNLVILGREGAPNSSGGGRMQVAKVNTSGNLVWRKQRNLGSDEFPVGIGVSPIGDIYTVTRIVNTNAVYGVADLVVDKLNSSGTQIWCKSYGTAFNEQPQKIYFDNTANRLIVAGRQQNGGADWGGWLAALDTNGSVAISKHFGSNSYSEEFNDITRVGNRYLMVGSSGALGGYLVQTDLAGTTTCGQTDIPLQSGAYAAPLINGTSHYSENLYPLDYVPIYDNFVLTPNVICASCSNIILSQTVTACGSYVVGGIARTQSGVYGDTLPASNGCDSMNLVYLTIDPVPTTANAGPNQNLCTTSATLAANAATSGTGNWSVVQGTATFTNAASPNTTVTGLSIGTNILRWTISSGSCTPSTSDVTIEVNSPPSVSIQATSTNICNGNSVTLTGQGASVYTWNPGGIVAPSITVQPAVNTTYTVVGLSPAGCTGNASVTIQVRQPSASTITTTACDSYTLNGQNYTQSGTYTQQLVNSVGCDSIITLNLTIRHATSTLLSIQACDTYTLNGQTYTQSGTYTQQLVNSVGCDSNITLQLSILHPTASTQTLTACDSITLNGQTYYASGSYQQLLTNSAGCDSTVNLHLTILHATSSSVTADVCDSYTLNGQNYTQSGTYTQQLVNSVGCDSTITLHLTIRHATSSSITASNCYSYTLNGQTYNASGVYQQQLINSVGCDSTITLNLTLYQASSSVITTTACDSYTLNGQTYSQSGTYTQQLTNSVGCDSNITLQLTVLHASSSTVTATACDNYTLNGQTYNASGVYQQQLVNSVGCDSILTLQLTILHATSSNLIVTACDSYTLNGQTYAASGTYLQQLTNSAGCDSNITLQLNLSYSSASSVTASACGNYTLNGQTYTSSGTYTQQLNNSVGCDSIITLYLTIHSATASTINASTCDTYTLNGQTYTTSGVYTQQLVNSNGCDSTITLVLTVQPFNTSVTQNNNILLANQSGADYQWVTCPGYQAIPGATSQSFVAATSGDYAVIVTYLSCTDTSSCYNVTFLDAGEQESASGIRLYPNPSDGMIYIQPADAENPAEITLYSLTGQVLMKRQEVTGSLVEWNLEELPAGMYVLEYKQGTNVTRERIILK